MTIWIVIDSKGILDFCRTYDHSHMQPSFKEHIYSVLFASIIGIVYIFMYINTADGNTFCRYMWFYTLCFLENTLSNFLWIVFRPPVVRNAWYFNKFHIISIVSFVLGITAMILYYTIFHPSTKNNIDRASPNIPTPCTSNISNISNEVRIELEMM